MRKLFRNAVWLAACAVFLAAAQASAGEWFGGGHYDGPLDVNIHSPNRVNDGSGEFFNLHELEAPHTIQGYRPPPPLQTHRGYGPHYAPPPPPPPEPYHRRYPEVVSHDGSLALPAPPSPHMGRDEYERWLEQRVPDLHDMPLGKRLRLEWEATGGWDNPRNYQPKHR